MKIERSKDLRIKVTDNDGGVIESQSVDAHILYEILQELKQIKRHLTSHADQISAFSDPGDES